jgi:hypothetical protein
MASKNFYSKEYWKIKIQQWLLSGKSAKSWCQENQVVYNTFLGWRDRLKCCHNQKANSSPNQNSLGSTPSKMNFIELKDQPKSCPGIFLECDGVQIHLSTEFDAAVLRKCLNILRGTAC